MSQETAASSSTGEHRHRDRVELVIPNTSSNDTVETAESKVKAIDSGGDSNNEDDSDNDSDNEDDSDNDGDNDSDNPKSRAHDRAFKKNVVCQQEVEQRGPLVVTRAVTTQDLLTLANKDVADAIRELTGELQKMYAHVPPPKPSAAPKPTSWYDQPLDIPYASDDDGDGQSKESEAGGGRGEGGNGGAGPAGAAEPEAD